MADRVPFRLRDPGGDAAVVVPIECSSNLRMQGSPVGESQANVGPFGDELTAICLRLDATANEVAARFTAESELETGNVAELESVPNAVNSALRTRHMKPYGLRRVSRNRITGSVIKP